MLVNNNRSVPVVPPSQEEASKPVVSDKKPETTGVEAKAQVQAQAQAQAQSQALEKAQQAQKAAVAQDAAKQAEEQKLKDAVEAINEKLNLKEASLEFRVDKESGKTVISVFDKKTDEKIKQIPSEEVLEMSKNLARNLNESLGQVDAQSAIRLISESV
jgi:flagellar protein FlaG